jgi:hypothetical protein
MPLPYSGDEAGLFQPIHYVYTNRTKRKVAPAKDDLQSRLRKRKSAVLVNVGENGPKMSPIITEGTPKPDQEMSQLSPTPPPTEIQQPWNGAKILKSVMEEHYDLATKVGRGGFGEVFKVSP